MAKPGWLLPALGGVATLATAGAAAPALLGAEGAALGAGEAGLIGAGEAAGGLGTAATVGELGSGLTADALLAAPATAATAGEVASSVPLAAGSAALTGAGDVTGLLGSTAGSGISTAAQLAGDAVSAAGSGDGAILGVSNTIPGESNLLTSTLEGAGTDTAVTGGAPATNLGGSTLTSAEGEDFFGAVDKGWWDKTGDWFSQNQGWLKPAAALGGLGLSIGRDTGIVPGSGPVTQAAKDATTQGAFLTGQANQNLGALNTGALPAGAQSAIDNASRAAKSTVRSQYAAMGMHAPPAALAAVDQQSAALKLAEAEKLVTLGAKESALATSQQDLASYDYNALMKAEVSQNKDLADFIARFAAALA